MLNNLIDDNIDTSIINDIKNTLSTDEDNKQFLSNFVNTIIDENKKKYINEYIELYD